MSKLDINRRIAALGLSFAIAGSLGGCKMTETQLDNDKQSTESAEEMISGGEYISLGDSEHPLKFLCIKKGEEIAVGFGNFRWDYKDGSQSALESTGFDEESGTFDQDANTDLYYLYFDNVLTEESVNLSKVEASAADEVRFYYTDAGNYFSLQSVIDNAVSRTELEEFVDSCTIEDLDTVGIYHFRDVDVDKFDVFDALTDSKLDSTMGNEPLVKVKK